MTDIWPLRNLGPSDYWGRTVEGRIRGLKNRRDQIVQVDSGMNRSHAASEQDLTRSITETARIAEELEEQIKNFPSYFVRARSAEGFGIGGAWLTIASVDVPPPLDATEVAVTAIAAVSSVQPASSTSHFEWPFPLSLVTSEFGPRPPLPFHNGIDFGVGIGTPIPAAGDGQVILKGFYSDWGNYIRVSHSHITGGSTWTGYAHLNTPATVNLGDWVTKGQIIGPSGDTGFVTGPHLHFETAVNGNERINPRDWMAIFGGTVSTVSEIRARIVIDGVASPEFIPTSVAAVQNIRLNFGRSTTPLGQTSVALQVRTTAGTTIPSEPGTRASLQVTGGFY